MDATTHSIATMTVANLKAYAKKQGFGGVSRMLKAELVELIDSIRHAEGDTVIDFDGNTATVTAVSEQARFPGRNADRWIELRKQDGTTTTAPHYLYRKYVDHTASVQDEVAKIAATLKPAMVESLTCFGRTGEWGNARVGTLVALLERGLVGHSRVGIEPDQITELGDAVLAVLGEKPQAAVETPVLRLRDTRTGLVRRILGTSLTTNAPHTTIVWVQREGEQGAYAWSADELMSSWHDLVAVDENDRTNAEQAEIAAAAHRTPRSGRDALIERGRSLGLSRAQLLADTADLNRIVEQAEIAACR
jgi:hypothetical protein